jgi:hypothetical protein
MPPHLIKDERPRRRKWKKEELKRLPPEAVKLIKRCREMKIRKTQHIALYAGVNPIYPSDDDDLNWNEPKDD